MPERPFWTIPTWKNVWNRPTKIPNIFPNSQFRRKKATILTKTFKWVHLNSKNEITPIQQFVVVHNQSRQFTYDCVSCQYIAIICIVKIFFQLVIKSHRHPNTNNKVCHLVFFRIFVCDPVSFNFFLFVASISWHYCMVCLTKIKFEKSEKILWSPIFHVFLKYKNFTSSSLTQFLRKKNFRCKNFEIKIVFLRFRGGFFGIFKFKLAFFWLMNIAELFRGMLIYSALWNLLKNGRKTRTDVEDKLSNTANQTNYTRQDSLLYYQKKWKWIFDKIKFKNYVCFF